MTIEEKLTNILSDLEHSKNQLKYACDDLGVLLIQKKLMKQFDEEDEPGLPKNLLPVDLKSILKLEVISKYFDCYDELELERRLK